MKTDNLHGTNENTSVKKTLSMQDLLKSKSRLSSPRGGNIYLSSTIVDELETYEKTRKPSISDGIDASQNSSGRFSNMNIGY